MGKQLSSDYGGRLAPGGVTQGAPSLPGLIVGVSGGSSGEKHPLLLFDEPVGILKWGIFNAAGWYNGSYRQ